LIVKSLNTNKTIFDFKCSKSKLVEDNFFVVGREDKSKSLAWVEQCVASTVGLDDDNRVTMKVEEKSKKLDQMMMNQVKISLRIIKFSDKNFSHSKLMDPVTISNDSFISEMNLIQNAIDTSRTSLKANLGHETIKKGVCCLESSKKLKNF
jgi:hypothetical protein